MFKFISMVGIRHTSPQDSIQPDRILHPGSTVCILVTDEMLIIESQVNTLATIECSRNRDISKAKCDFDHTRFSGAVKSPQCTNKPSHQGVL